MIIQFSAIIKEHDSCEVDQVIEKFSEFETIELINLRDKKSLYVIESLEIDEITKSNCEGELLYCNKTHIKQYIRTNQKTLNFGDLVIIDNVEFLVINSSGELYLQSVNSDLNFFKGKEINNFNELYTNLTYMKDDFFILKNV